MSGLESMEHDQPPKKIRKGAKSCTECRRRKIRCVWLSDDAQVCRRCEERGSECVPQVFSSQPAKVEGSSSRERLARLEQQVGSIIAVVNTIQRKQGGPLVSETFSEAVAVDDGLSDEESEEADGPETHRPAYLATLFNNNVISPGEQENDTQPPKESFSKLLARKARDNLQKLIPSEHDVRTVAVYSSSWLSFYQAMFPTNAIAQSEEDIIAQYTSVKRSDVDPTSLATWLVTMAITVQQVPHEKFVHLSGIRNSSHYTRAVTAAVEANIIAHDSLMGTMGGLHCALHFIRLQSSHADFKKIWLTLRRVIAIAELMGLPRTLPSTVTDQEPRHPSTFTANEDRNAIINSRESKAETWISICTLDRIIGMMCNLPIGTSRYVLPSVRLDPDNARKFVPNYLQCLSGIASKVLELDDLRISGGSNDEIYAEVLKVDRDLISLASSAPKEWWDDNKLTELPLQLLPYWHYYITLRTHLLLTLERDDNNRFDYSRFTCMYACQQALQRFLKMRPEVAGGFFLGRMLDLQALTATIVLLLSYHAAKSDFGFHFQAQTVGEPSNLVMQVIAVMEDTIQRKGSDFARLAAPALRSLKSLLEDDGRFQAKDLTLRVPLLGKVHIKKKNNNSQGLATQSHGRTPASDYSPSFGSLNSLPTPTATSFMASDNNQKIPSTNNWDFDPFTWVIEDDRESAFRDALLAEDFSHFDSPFSNDSFHFTN